MCIFEKLRTVFNYLKNYFNKKLISDVVKPEDSKSSFNSTQLSIKKEFPEFKQEMLDPVFEVLFTKISTLFNRSTSVMATNTNNIVKLIVDDMISNGCNENSIISIATINRPSYNREISYLFRKKHRYIILVGANEEIDFVYKYPSSLLFSKFVHEELKDVHKGDLIDESLKLLYLDYEL